jgi:serine/threonine protein kinase
MGVVWQGAHRLAGAPVAVKVISHAWSREPGAQAAFRREVRAIASLAHPGIVTVHDVGEVDERAAAASGGRLIARSPYLAMELLPHGNLERLLPVIDWPLLRQLAHDLLGALGHAHAHGVVHCDVKPQNVLLAEGPGGRLTVKLTDFGVAHALAAATDAGEAEGARQRRHPRLHAAGAARRPLARLRPLHRSLRARLHVVGALRRPPPLPRRRSRRARPPPPLRAAAAAAPPLRRATWPRGLVMPPPRQRPRRSLRPLRRRCLGPPRPRPRPPPSRSPGRSSRRASAITPPPIPSSPPPPCLPAARPPSGSPPPPPWPVIA